MNLILKGYHLQKRFLRILYRTSDFRSAKEKILLSKDFSDEEKSLLNNISLRIHHNDSMYQPKSAPYYLSVGFSAIRCIENAIRKADGDKSIQHILDFPCGYGRVLRFLTVRFPEANFTVSDIDPAALDFCRSVFSVRSVMSDRDFRLMSLRGKFDLIWCGSLITHLDEKNTTNLLKFFHDHLTPGGLCMFSTHGKTTMEWIQGKRETYRLSETAQQKVLSEYKEKGYGYSDYKNQHGYGISVVSHDRMLAIARSVGQWNETFYLERGLDNHQDVYGFTHDETGA